MKHVLKSNTMKAIITIAGMGIGVFNMLASQLGKTRENTVHCSELICNCCPGQMMCPLGYGSTKAGIAAGALILAGLIGSFVIGFLGRKFRKQLEFAKVAFPVAAIFGIFIVMSLRFPDVYPAILISLMGFGFFGLGVFPLCLELAVEVSRDRETEPW